MARYIALLPSRSESVLHDLWDFPDTRRIFDQSFGHGMNDALPLSFSSCYVRPRHQFDRSMSGSSEVRSKTDKFHVALDVNQFEPLEVSVKTVDNYVVVHGKHEDKPDAHGFISREFTRRYLLPDGVDPENIVSSLSQDGYLTIEAPRKPPEPKERLVPINVQTADNDQQEQPIDASKE